jgi:NAD(P) transhydrogenase subunit beta
VRAGIELAYALAALLFIAGLKMLSSPQTARRGNGVSALGMLLAVMVTLAHRDVLDLRWIAVGLVVGGIAGVFAARMVAMTSMPQMVALLNGCGGLASLLVAWGCFHRTLSLETFLATVVFLSVLIGGATFSGSIMAWAKLSEAIPGRPILFRGQRVLNGMLLAGTLAGGGFFALNQGGPGALFASLLGASLLLGVLAVMPIGGADMPVVIALLNSYSGLAAAATGFLLRNSMLIVTGALVGASGLILCRVMCRAMNRSLSGVLLGGFGVTAVAAAGETKRQVKTISPAEAWAVLEAARSIVVVPGYGMAAAQAQHAVRELAGVLEGKGSEVRFAIHPVAGRMPGHMNVLLAEANIPYDQLVEMEVINPVMDTVDACLVIGANDVVNPAAHEDKSSPLYGMPIIEADRARTVFVLKRSLGHGFAGIDNRLFSRPNTRLLLGDAKASLQALVAEFKSP